MTNFFWQGFEKQANRTVGQILESLVHSLATRAGRSSAFAESIIDKYFQKNPNQVMGLWRKQSPQELLEEVKFLNQYTKGNPQAAQQILEEMKNALLGGI